MSLLIDALKQAEAAREKAQQGDTPSPDAEIELTPLEETIHAAPVTRVAAPAPASNQEARRNRHQVNPSTTYASDAARELFEIKRQTNAPLAISMPILIAAIAALVFVIGAAYVWWAIQPRSSLMVSNVGANNTPAPITRATPDAPTPIKQPEPQPVVEPSPAAYPVNAPVAALPRTSQTTRAARPAPLPKQNLAAIASAAPAISKTARTGELTAVNDANGIQAAYTAFLDRNYPLARQRYQDVLRQDPRNIDAMNALGLIAWRSGQPDAAERMFRAAVQTDPKDATAISQLALLYAEGDPTAAESRLRNLIASQPASAASYYALGSLMARQERWGEAQQALFQAYTLDSDNPDVLFNLAICLERLSQAKVALQFYERSLQAATHRPAGFDKGIAQRRVQALARPQ